MNLKLVNELRAETGAGVLKCKQALEQANGNKEEAIKLLRKSGDATARRIASREANQGRIESYIHVGSKVGVLIEVNCETDFVANTEEFINLCRELCLQIVALSPRYVNQSEVPAAIITSERDIALAGALEQGKSLQAAQKITEGKLNRFFAVECLLDQPFIKDSEKTVNDIVKDKIARLGENIIVKRFIRYQVGAQ
jgi:elongation factor Ts